MMPLDPDQEERRMGMPAPKYIVLVAAIIFIGGVVAAWLGGMGYLPIDPGMVLGMSVLLATVIVCCSSTMTITSFMQRVPEYGDMEIRFEEGKMRFDNEEWEYALEIFKTLAGPKLDHKRALYYGARCYEELSDWENMKRWCKAYLEMTPKDKEVWEMLNRAHKRLFEYDEAEDALNRANEL
ncbi:MAG: tetratricopeptide repeat protein [Candidatus Thorarchaeota archaeon]